MLFDIADGILHGENSLRRLVRNLEAKFLLERHHQFDRVEAVRTQIVDKAGVVGDLRIIDTEVLDDNLLNALGGIAHD